MSAKAPCYVRRVRQHPPWSGLLHWGLKWIIPVGRSTSQNLFGQNLIKKSPQISYFSSFVWLILIVWNLKSRLRMYFINFKVKIIISAICYDGLQLCDVWSELEFWKWDIYFHVLNQLITVHVPLVLPKTISRHESFVAEVAGVCLPFHKLCKHRRIDGQW